MNIMDYIREADSPVDLMLKHQGMPGGPLPMIAARVRRLDAIVSDLRKNAFAPGMKIFGDAAKDGGDLPSEIDAFIDYSKIPLDKNIASTAFTDLLRISSAYRHMLNPYVLLKKGLYTRDAESKRWVLVKDRVPVISAGRVGIPLTLFDKNFTTMAHAGLSESNHGIKGYIERVEKDRNATVIFEGYEISARLARDHTPMEIAMILGGH